MDEVFSENMGLMQKLHLSYDLQAPIANATTASLQQIKDETTIFTKSALLNLKKESDTLVSEFSSQLHQDTTSQDTRDTIISDILANKNQATTKG